MTCDYLRLQLYSSILYLKHSVTNVRFQLLVQSSGFKVQTLNPEPFLFRLVRVRHMRSSSLIKPYLKENRLLIFFGLISLIIVDVLQLFIPRVIKWSVDDLTTFQINLTGLLEYSLYLAGIGLLIGVFRYFWRHCLLGTSRRVEEGLRNVLFSHDYNTLFP